MSTLSKVILGFVIVAAMVLLYLAMRTLKTHEVWRKAHEAHLKKIADLQSRIKIIEEGIDSPGLENKSIGKLQTELFGVLYDRGRVWRNCEPQRPDPQGNTVVTINTLKPDEIKAGTILYAFSREDAATGKYLGEFKAANVAATTITLQPTLQRTPADLQKLAAQGAPGTPWTLYELMPGDSNDIFIDPATSKPQDEVALRRTILKGATETPADFEERVKEYIKDGKPPEENDPPERIRILVKFTKDFDQLEQPKRVKLAELKIPQDVVKNGQLLEFDKAIADELVEMADTVTVIERSYERPLRDYNFVFREINRQTPVWLDRLDIAKKQLAFITNARNDAKTHETFHKEEIDVLTTELNRLKAEVAAVTGYEQSLEKKVDTALAQIAALQTENKELASQLATRQREALQRGPRRTTATAAR